MLVKPRILSYGFHSLRRFCTVNRFASDVDECDESEDVFQVYKQIKEDSFFPNVLEVADAISSMRFPECLRKESEDYSDLHGRQYADLLHTSQLSSFIFSKRDYLCENVLVVHPKIRWGANSASKTTTPELQLEEAVTLSRTIPGFNVIGAVIVGTDYHTKKKLIWGDGRLHKIFNFKVQHNITALMINVAMLTPLQRMELGDFFRVPVYDRYNVVLSIFKLYAKTKEAHFQISLAEIPYIRDENTDEQMESLRLREHSLRKKIRAAINAKSAECEAECVDKTRPQRGCVVAVIGYTNAGKTTLIKNSHTYRLTDSTSLCGENRLFATLDTTIHGAVLPSRLRVVLADTIGFISDLPLRLFASFSATLRHVANANLLIHVQDFSHPNVLKQHENVIETLRGLQISEELIESMISVGNKIDRATADQLSRLQGASQLASDEPLLISCRTGDGLSELIRRIDMRVQRITGTRLRRFKLPPTSKAIAYLYNNDLLTEEPTMSDCGKYLQFNLLMNDAEMTKFQANSGIKLKKAIGMPH